jgi:Uma2 family endonuclease
MSASPKPHPSPTLDEFLRMPDIEEAPGLEYIDGRVVEKAMPNRSHGRVAMGFARRFDEFAEPEGLGVSEIEVRHTFAGRSILPDASFQLMERVDLKPDGTSEDFVPYPPDIHIEIISPDQSVPQTHSKLLHSVSNGCTIGVMVHPEKRTIDVYRTGRPPERLPDDGAIDFAPVLPGLVIPVAEVFSWMVVRPNRPGAGPA